MRKPKISIFALTAGRVVRNKFTKHYGHILSFALNCFEDTVVLVKWSDGTESHIHPDCITIS